MNSFDLAWRNVRRNARRSILTLFALAVGSMAVLLFSGYVTDTVQGLQTSTVRTTGHFQLVANGYLQFGRGNPGRFAIRNADAVIDALRADPTLRPMLVLATPELAVEGIAGSAETSTSTSFSGVGVLPADHARQLAWDGFGIGIRPSASDLRADAPESGVIGHGLAQLLGLCARLALDDCRALPTEQAQETTSGGAGSELPADIAALSTRDAPAAQQAGPPQIDLLTASATGNPNVVRMTVGAVKQQAIREVDSMYVSMPLALAQRLVFGPGQHGASAIVLQLRQTSDMDAAAVAIRRIVKQHGWPLELVSFHEISSVYDQIVENYSMIFQFIATLIVLITLFSIANAINMAISERTGEIGTLRALGFPRATIRSIFIAEGAVIGAVGATLGVLLAIGIAYGVINAGGFSWTPPGRSTPIPIRVEMFSGPWLILGTAIGLIVTAILSAIVPASRAARLEITEALRHA